MRRSSTGHDGFDRFRRYVPLLNEPGACLGKARVGLGHRRLQLLSAVGSAHVDHLRDVRFGLAGGDDVRALEVLHSGLFIVMAYGYGLLIVMAVYIWL